MSSNVKCRMRKAAQLFLQGHGSESVAATLNARTSTILRWQTHPNFLQAFEQQKEALCTEMRLKVLHKAIATFDAIIEDAEEGMHYAAEFDNIVRSYETIGKGHILAPDSIFSALKKEQIPPK